MEHILYKAEPGSITRDAGHNVHNFTVGDGNIDFTTVEAFGDEWTKFNSFSDREIEEIASAHYFDIVKPEWISGKRILDVGCGTGRWTKYAAKYAATVDAVDPSKAIVSAASLLFECKNVRLSRASVDGLPFSDNSFDFVFSLGVLHHIPDTQLAMKQCVEKLKTGGYFLVYLYYKFDNRGAFFQSIFKFSDMIRKVISGMPAGLKNLFCDFIAVTVYLPLVLLGTLFKSIGLKKAAHHIPLHFYVGKTFNVIRNDARDRFGTPLEQRFTKQEIKLMMENAGLTDIVFSDQEPYWHAVGKKK